MRIQKESAMKQESAEKDNAFDGQSAQMQIFATPKSPKLLKNKAHQSTKVGAYTPNSPR